MATAKKLPSGSWRCLVYSHTERTFDAKSGTWKDKRIYESFTSDDPSRRGKADAERQAAEFQQEDCRSDNPLNMMPFLNDRLHRLICAVYDFDSLRCLVRFAILCPCHVFTGKTIDFDL